MAAISGREIFYWGSSLARSLGLAGAIFVVSASAGVQTNTIDPAAEISEKGRHVRLTGPIACTVGERADIQVTLTQRATGAIAEGRTHFTCTGYLQQWEVRAEVRGREKFEPGAAAAVALGITSLHGRSGDSHQWLVQVTLVN